MKQGTGAKLKMKKNLHKNAVIDQKMYFCKVLRYDAKWECIYLVLENDLLSTLSLDAIYECSIEKTGECIACTGRIRERYANEFGNILKFEIENGFYKINLKSVDK